MGRGSIRHRLLTVHYDGGNVGTFLGDAIRNIWGEFSGRLPNNDGASGAFYIYAINDRLIVEQLGDGYHGLMFDASRVVPTDTNNHPASMSGLFVISY